MSFFAELKRRKVFKVGAAYLVVAWLAVQVVSIAFPAFEAPPWALRVFILLSVLGFPVTLLLAWAFETTPEGLKRDTSTLGNKRMAAIAGVFVTLALAWYFLGAPALRPDERVAAAEATDAAATSTAVPVPAPAPSPKSIAVLPFADFSPDGDQSWFADGLAEEILNALARTPDLSVAARTSSFRYKGSTLAIPQIAKELGVAHVLEGSVRSSPGRVRVTAQLIRASDGFHVWSQNYDRDAADMIAIQEDLARQIAIAMQTGMDPAALADMAQVGTQSVEAYQAYLRGVSKGSVAADFKTFRTAYEQFELARTLDPTFAAAHARAANFWLAMLDPTLTITEPVDESPEKIRANFRERIDLAIRHATRDVDRYASRALKALHDLRFREAIELQRKVLAERPNDREATGSLLDLLTRSSQFELMQEPLDKAWSLAHENQDWANMHLNAAHRGLDRHRAADQALELAERWRDSEANLYQAHRALLWDGRVDAAREVLARWRELSGESQWAILPPARQASAEGRCDEVERLLETVPAADISQRWHMLMLLDRRDEAAQLLMPFERSGNVFALAGFLSYRHFDPSPFPSLMRVLERERIQRPPAERLPFACRAPGAAE